MMMTTKKFMRGDWARVFKATAKIKVEIKRVGRAGDIEHGAA